MIAILLLLLAAVLLLAGVGLYFRAERQRQSAGLPAGEVIAADVGAWRRSERPLLSRRYGLVGRPDYLVDTADGLVPVEVKSSRLAGPDPYPGHKLQLAAYCLLVEDTTGSRPPYGIVHYANTTVRLPFTDDLRTTLLQTLTAMRQARRRGRSPYLPSRQVRRSHDDPTRCRRCGFRHACGSEALD
jgi:CRISPR-associated exonuclease Cas4